LGWGACEGCFFISFGIEGGAVQGEVRLKK
jgi:hypothetical protein